jgi:hypothetical protein
MDDIDEQEQRHESLMEMVEETRELALDNHKILRSLQRGALIRRLISFVYLLVLLGSLLFTYYYLEPYINNLTKVYNTGLSQNASTTQAMFERFFQNKK